MKQFRTHTGAIVQGVELQSALSKVADWYADNASGIRREDAYASHVSEAAKDANLVRGLAYAESVRAGNVDNFSVWQRINTELTGECIAFLPASV